MRATLRGVLAGLVVLAAIVAVVVANVVLLGYGDSSQDPVGALSPRVTLEPVAPHVPHPALPTRGYEDD